MSPITLPTRGHITHDPAFQCSAEGCILRYRALGLCDTHYRQKHRREVAELAWSVDRPQKRVRIVRGGIVRWEVRRG